MEFEGSEKTLVKDLDLFRIPGTQDCVERVQYVEYRPLNQLSEGNPIDLLIPGGTDYIDLARSLLHIKFRITRADGTEYPDTEEVGIINFLLMTMFSQCDVMLNGKLVSSSSTNFGYLCMIRMLLTCDAGAKNTRLRSMGHYKDTSYFLDDPRCKLGENVGLYNRFGLVEGGKPCHFYGPLLADVCQLQKYLLSGVDVQIRLWPNKSVFALVKEDSLLNDYKIKITDLYYHVMKVTPRPEIVLSQNRALTSRPALYPYNRHRIQTYSLSQNSYMMREDQIFQNDVPQQLVVAFVASDAYSGSYTKNPFNFQHYDVNTIALYKNDEALPFQPIKLNFETGDYLQSYYSLFTMMNADQGNFDNDISPMDFAGGYGLFLFDFNVGIGNRLLPVINTGVIRLEAYFTNPLPEPVTCIVLGTFRDVFSIDVTRNVRPRMI